MAVREQKARAKQARQRRSRPNDQASRKSAVRRGSGRKLNDPSALAGDTEIFENIEKLSKTEAIEWIDVLAGRLKVTRAKLIQGDLEATIAATQPSPGVAAGKAAAQQLLDRLDGSPETRLLSAGEMATYTHKGRNWPSEATRRQRLISVEHAGKTFYPAFQIDPQRRAPRSWVATMVEVLEDREMDGRSFALWAASPSQRFGGDIPADHADEDTFLVKAAGDLADL